MKGRGRIRERAENALVQQALGGLEQDFGLVLQAGVLPECMGRPMVAAPSAIVPDVQVEGGGAAAPRAGGIGGDASHTAVGVGERWEGRAGGASIGGSRVGVPDAGRRSCVDAGAGSRSKYTVDVKQTVSARARQHGDSHASCPADGSGTADVPALARGPPSGCDGASPGGPSSAAAHEPGYDAGAEPLLILSR